MSPPPPLARRRFRIRHHECDAYGHLNNTAYLFYLDEVELDTGVAADHDPILADIHYREPLQFGDEVELEVTTVGGSAGLMARDYEFRRRRDHLAVADARVMWSHPDAAGAAPPEWLEPPAPAPPPPPRVYRSRRRVEWRDVDERSALRPATLSTYAEDCGVALCADFGWPLRRCLEEGFAMVLRRHQIDYGRAIELGDELAITTYASDLRRVSAVRHYLMEGPDGPVARFRSHYVWVDPATTRPIRIPSAFLEDFTPNFAT